MASVQISTIDSGTSPRSTVLASSDHMTTGVDKMNASKVASGGLANTGAKAATPNVTRKAAPHVAKPEVVTPSSSGEGKDAVGNLKVPAVGKSSEQSPKQQAQASLPASQQHPNLASGYYLGYANGAPPSPTVTASTVTLPYDAAIGSFGQHQSGTFVAAHTSPFAVVPAPNTPLSPPRSTITMVGSVPPASPLFPRTNNGSLEVGLSQQQAGGVPQSSNLPYMSTSIGSASMVYPPAYAATARIGSQTSLSSDDGGWDRNPNNYLSPQMGTQGMMYAVMGRAGSGGRTYSMDSESMLPPAALDHLDQANPAYSPYSAGHSSPGGTVFTHQQQWTYPNPVPDMYSAPGSPLQPRHTVLHPQQMQMYAADGQMTGGMRPMGNPYVHPHQYYPASTPGPPIQTTTSNKGPDGANLFIFHIPNHFTNVDMYNLFCQYGILLSVRIMVEKDTGRSRGFGFVSYDNAESAALAIKELNGYAIGNKRLKVQHKQIRQRDMQDRDGVYGDTGRESYGRPPSQMSSSSLPPSGPSATSGQNLWYDPRAAEGARSAAGTATVVSAAETVAQTDGPDEADADLPPSSPPGKESLGDSPDEEASPLANFSTLQSALPAVTAGASSPQG